MVVVILRIVIMENLEEKFTEELRFNKQTNPAHWDVAEEMNSAKLAEVIHKLMGLSFKQQSSDENDFLQLAALLNAAIKISPSNNSLLSDLRDLCRQVLNAAQAKYQDADLVKKAEEVRIIVFNLRNEVKDFLLNSVPEIPINTNSETFQVLKRTKILPIQQISKAISNRFKHIITDLCQFCEDVLGKPPCDYCIAETGSVASEEITPYSNFKLMLVLIHSKNYQSNLSYFKWLLVIFYVIVINLQETPFSKLDIKSLTQKNYRLESLLNKTITQQGIKFQAVIAYACKADLSIESLQNTPAAQGLTELIKPVCEISHLFFKLDVKNLDLLDCLTNTTCFVYGSESLYNHLFEDAVKLQNKLKINITDNIEQQAQQDLKEHSIRGHLSQLKTQSAIDIEQLVCESITKFLRTLGRIFKVSGKPYFELIINLAKHDKISQHTAEQLKFGIAVAYEMRLRLFMQNKTENGKNSVNDISRFLDVVGVASTVNFFQIAYCLQREVAKQLNLTKLHFYCHSHLINVTIGLALELTDIKINSSKVEQKLLWDAAKFDFDTCIKELESDVQFNSNILYKFAETFSKPVFHFFDKYFNLYTEQLKLLANHLNSQQLYDEALEFYMQLLRFYQNKSKEKNQDFDIARTLYQIGYCLDALDSNLEALNYLNQALKIHKNLSSNVENNKNMAATYRNIGRCLRRLYQYEDALTNYKQALSNLSKRYIKS